MILCFGCRETVLLSSTFLLLEHTSVRRAASFGNVEEAREDATAMGESGTGAESGACFEGGADTNGCTVGAKV